MLIGGADPQAQLDSTFNGTSIWLYYNPLMYLFDRDQPFSEGEVQGGIAFLKLLLTYGIYSLKFFMLFYYET